MDKERILEKSRKENKNQDEMERQIRIEGESFSLVITLLVGIFLLAWKFAHRPHTADGAVCAWVRVQSRTAAERVPARTPAKGIHARYPAWKRLAGVVCRSA